MSNVEPFSNIKLDTIFVIGRLGNNQKLVGHDPKISNRDSKIN